MVKLCWMLWMLSIFSVEMDPVHETPKRPVLGYFLQETQSCNKSQMFMVVEALRLQFHATCQEILSELIIGYHGSCSISVIHDFVTSNLMMGI